MNVQRSAFIDPCSSCIVVLIIPPIFPFARRSKRTAIAPLTLTAATYAVGASVTLEFDRAIDITSLNATLIGVDDGSLRRLYGGIAGTLVDPQTVQISLSDLGRSFGHQILLNADAGAGIIAAADGAAWLGVDGLELPFP